MPDVLNGNGLQTKTLTEIRDELITALRSIYGDDINVDQNTPDGQLINLFAQAGIDLREQLSKINAGFDPDQAEGRVLDQRVALNGIVRNTGTFTTVPVEIITDRALTLVGLDSQSAELEPTIENLYTVRDNEGTEFYLLATESIGAAGTYELSFRAAELGEVLVSPNTITTPVTVVRGVTGVNNPSGPSNIGTDEETDAQLRERRRASTSISATGYLDAIESALRNIDNVVTAIVLENVTNTTDSDGIPPHSIWAIVEGGDQDEIGQAIYTKKSSGSGMKGSITVDVPRPDGTTFPAQFDRPVDQDLYIRFNLVLPGGTVDTDEVERQIVENVTWDVGASAVASTITAFVQSLNSNYQITGMEVSDDDSTYLEVVSPAAPVNRFVNSTDRITIS